MKEPCCQFSESNLLSKQQPGIFRDLHCNASANNAIKYNPALALEALPDYGIWPVQTPYPFLLGVFTSFAFIDFRQFPLHYVSTPNPWSQMIPRSSQLTLQSDLLNHLSKAGGQVTETGSKPGFSVATALTVLPSIHLPQINFWLQHRGILLDRSAKFAGR